MENAERRITDILFGLADRVGFNTSMSLDEIRSKVGGSVSTGRIDFFLHKMVKSGQVEMVNAPMDMTSYLNRDLRNISGFLTEPTQKNYRISLEYYDQVYQSRGLGPPDAWEPIEIERHEELSNAAIHLAEKILQENGYVEAKPEEARYISKKLKVFGQSVRVNLGKVLPTSIEDVMRSLKRLGTFFQETSRIGASVKVLLDLIKSYV